MKKLIVLSSLAVATLCLFTGCVAIGNDLPKNTGGTLGQQLIDLKNAEAMGAITEAEYQNLRAKLLGKK